MSQRLQSFFPKLPAYLLVILIPLIHVPYLNSSVFSAPKLLVLRAITLGTIAFISYQILLQRKFKYRKSLFNFFLLAYALSAVISTIFSDFIFTSLLGIDGRFLGLFTVLNFLIISFYSFNAFSQVEDLKKLLKVSILVATITALYGIIQDQVWFENITRDLFKWGISPTLRTFSTFGHSTHFALYLGMHLPIILAQLSAEKPNRTKYAASFLIISWALITTGSRGALAATLIALMGFALWLSTKFGRQFSKKSILITAVTIVVLIWATIFTPFQYVIRELKPIQRLETTVNQIENGQITDRQSWWYSSLSMWRDRPIVGHGLSTFADVYNRYRRTDYVLAEDYQDLTVPHYAHMDYFNILATQGLLGLLTYLALLFWFFRKIYFYSRDPKNSLNNRIIVCAASTSIAIFLLNMFVNFGVISTLTFFYLILGATAGVVTTDKSYIKKQFPHAVLSSSLIILIIVGVLFTFSHYAADIAKSSADKNQFQNQEQAFSLAIQLNPTEYSYYADYADSLVQKAQVSDDIAYSQEKLKLAIALYHQAEALNDSHPYINNHLAIAYKELTKIAAENSDPSNYDQYHQAARENYEKAIQKGPNNPRYLYNYAQFLTAANEQQKAIELYQQILKIRPNYRDVQDRLSKLQSD